MPSKTVLVCIFCSLLGSTIATAGERNSIRKSFELSIPVTENEIEIGSILNSKGIILDEHSNLQIHQEENQVNLSCFNCIVRGVDRSEKITGAKNDEVSK